MLGGHLPYVRKYVIFENQGFVRLTNKMSGVSLVLSRDISFLSAINLHKSHPLTKEVGLIVKSYYCTLATHTALLFIPTSCWVNILLIGFLGTYTME